MVFEKSGLLVEVVVVSESDESESDGGCGGG